MHIMNQISVKECGVSARKQCVFTSRNKADKGLHIAKKQHVKLFRIRTTDDVFIVWGIDEAGGQRFYPAFKMNKTVPVVANCVAVKEIKPDTAFYEPKTDLYYYYGSNGDDVKLVRLTMLVNERMVWQIFNYDDVPKAKISLCEFYVRKDVKKYNNEDCLQINQDYAIDNPEVSTVLGWYIEVDFKNKTKQTLALGKALDSTSDSWEKQLLHLWSFDSVNRIEGVLYDGVIFIPLNLADKPILRKNLQVLTKLYVAHPEVQAGKIYNQGEWFYAFNKSYFQGWYAERSQNPEDLNLTAVKTESENEQWIRYWMQKEVRFM